MVDAAELLRRLRRETDAMVGETERLARIDSGSDSPDGIARVCELTADLFNAAGFTTARPSRRRTERDAYARRRAPVAGGRPRRHRMAGGNGGSMAATTRAGRRSADRGWGT